MVKKIDRSIPVSANNPFPFLRALVAAGQLSDDREPLDRVAAVIIATASAGDGSPELPSAAVVGIGLVANGLNPLALMDAMRHGMRLNALRGGPLDKKGVGSGILDSRGAVNAKELARLRGFAKTKVSDDGSSELGLGLPELRSYVSSCASRRHLFRRRRSAWSISSAVTPRRPSNMSSRSRC